MQNPPKGPPMVYAGDLNAFKQSLFELSVGWEDLPLRDEDVLRLQLASERTAMRMCVEAYIVPADRLDHDEEPEQVTVAVYNRDDDFMLDASFLLSGYLLATEFVSDVIEERQAIVVYDKDGDWGGSETILPAAVQKHRKPTVDDVILAANNSEIFTGRPIRYIRSWNGTYDWR